MGHMYAPVRMNEHRPISTSHTSVRCFHFDPAWFVLKNCSLGHFAGSMWPDHRMMMEGWCKSDDERLLVTKSCFCSLRSRRNHSGVRVESLLRNRLESIILFLHCRLINVDSLDFGNTLTIHGGQRRLTIFRRDPKCSRAIKNFVQRLEKETRKKDKEGAFFFYSESISLTWSQELLPEDIGAASRRISLIISHVWPFIHSSIVFLTTKLQTFLSN